jgi:hypothetical protein
MTNAAMNIRVQFLCEYMFSALSVIYVGVVELLDHMVTTFNLFFFALLGLELRALPCAC